VELRALLRQIEKRRVSEEKAAVLRSGLVAATVYNVHRKKGSRAAKPTDFIRQEARVLSPEEMERQMDAWARSVNRKKGGKA
jgi:hypothetical protein